jgi:hypothetical protein
MKLLCYAVVSSERSLNLNTATSTMQSRYCMSQPSKPTSVCSQCDAALFCLYTLINSPDALLYPTPVWKYNNEFGYGCQCLKITGNAGYAALRTSSLIILCRVNTVTKPEQGHCSAGKSKYSGGGTGQPFYLTPNYALHVAY